jgi:hypothetical protein
MSWSWMSALPGHPLKDQTDAEVLEAWRAAWRDGAQREPATHDLTSVWSWCVFWPDDDGMRAFIQVHAGGSPRPGDFLILPNEDRTTRYRVVKITTPLAADVEFWSAELEFAPRPAPVAWPA